MRDLKGGRPPRSLVQQDAQPRKTPASSQSLPPPQHRPHLGGRVVSPRSWPVPNSRPYVRSSLGRPEKSHVGRSARALLQDVDRKRTLFFAAEKRTVPCWGSRPTGPGSVH